MGINTANLAPSGGNVSLKRVGQPVSLTVERVDLSRLTCPQTRIMVNLGNPDQALQTAQLPVDGVGLARMEFIIIGSIKAHPMALIHPDRVEDAAERDHIARLIRHYTDGAEFLVRLGIDSISLTPDSVLKTLCATVDLERQLGRAPRRSSASRPGQS